MKLSTTTALAILASSAAVQAAPIDAANAAQLEFATSTDLTFIKKSDVAQIKSLIAEISHINKKRELVEDPVELAELEARADSALGNLLSAVLNSGILGDIFSTITTDSGIRSALGSIISATLQAVISSGPALLQAIWNSGLLSKIWTDIQNSDIGSAFVAALPELLNDVLSLISTLFGSGSSTTASAKREIVDLAQLSGDEYLSKRDLASVIQWVINEISSSGIITTLWNKFIANPQQYLSQLVSILETAWSVGKQIFAWAQSSGLLSSALTWLENNGGSFLSTIAKLLASLFGTSTSTGSTTSTATTTAKAAAAAYTAATSTVTTHTTTTAAVYATAAAATGGVNAVFAAANGNARRNY